MSKFLRFGIIFLFFSFKSDRLLTKTQPLVLMFVIIQNNPGDGKSNVGAQKANGVLQKRGNRKLYTKLCTKKNTGGEGGESNSILQFSKYVMSALEV